MISLSYRKCSHITLLSSSQQGGFIFTPVVLNNSYEIFGLSAVLESVGGTVEDLWWCSIFLIGSNNEIVATTRPVRSAVKFMFRNDVHDIVNKHWKIGRYSNTALL